MLLMVALAGTGMQLRQGQPGMGPLQALGVLVEASWTGNSQGKGAWHAYAKAWRNLGIDYRTFAPRQEPEKRT